MTHRGAPSPSPAGTTAPVPAPAGGALRLAPWLLLGALGALVIAERRRPLRERTAPQAGRTLRNALTGAGAAAVVLAASPLTGRLADIAERRGWGIAARPPAPWRGPAALLLMDASLAAWHVLLHRAPALWRWHRVHHADARPRRFHRAALPRRRDAVVGAVAHGAGGA